jgi:hypothetical protein
MSHAFPAKATPGGGIIEMKWRFKRKYNNFIPVGARSLRWLMEFQNKNGRKYRLTVPYCGITL